MCVKSETDFVNRDNVPKYELLTLLSHQGQSSRQNTKADRGEEDMRNEKIDSLIVTTAIAD